MNKLLGTSLFFLPFVVVAEFSSRQLNRLNQDSLFSSTVDIKTDSSSVWFQDGKMLPKESLDQAKERCRLQMFPRLEVLKGETFSLRDLDVRYGSKFLQTDGFVKPAKKLTFLGFRAENKNIGIYCKVGDISDFHELTTNILTKTFGSLIKFNFQQLSSPGDSSVGMIEEVFNREIEFKHNFESTGNETLFIQSGMFVEQPTLDAPYCYLIRPNRSAYSIQKGTILKVAGVYSKFNTSFNNYNIPYFSWVMFNDGVSSEWLYSLKFVCHSNNVFQRITIEEFQDTLGNLVKIR